VWGGVVGSGRDLRKRFVACHVTEKLRHRWTLGDEQLSPPLRGTLTYDRFSRGSTGRWCSSETPASSLEVPIRASRISCCIVSIRATRASRAATRAAGVGVAAAVWVAAAAGAIDDGAAHRHGPFHSWTRKVAGKTVTRNLSDDQLQRYQDWFDNDRRLKALVAELEELSNTNVDQAEGWTIKS
jgi:hypothetical protein